MKMGIPHLVRSRNYLKLACQRFVEPIGVLESVDRSIMGIATIIYFEIIDLVEGSNTYLYLVQRTW